MMSEHRAAPLRAIAATIAVCAMATNGAAWAASAGCGFERFGEGRVAAIIDNRTFRLDDGREIRLQGIETTEAEPQNGAALGALIAGKVVTLKGDSDAPDRYGRQVAMVYMDSEDRSVQAALLARGEALAAVTVTDPGCAAELAAAETSARRARRGAWARPDAIKTAENPDGILARVGQFAIVEGKVLSVRQVRSVVYVNFGRRWTRDFAVTISRRVMPAFEAAGFGAKSLEHRRVRVRGWVERRGGPRIEAVRTGQIEWAGDIASAPAGTHDDRAGPGETTGDAE